MTRYRLVAEYEPEAFHEAVEALLADGWRLQGGGSVFARDVTRDGEFVETIWTYSQALIRDEPAEG